MSIDDATLDRLLKLLPSMERCHWKLMEVHESWKALENDYPDLYDCSALAMYWVAEELPVPYDVYLCPRHYSIHTESGGRPGTVIENARLLIEAEDDYRSQDANPPLEDLDEDLL